MILIAVGSGITSLLPVYVVRLGASRTTIGLLLSVAFSSLAIGTMSAGWLSERIQSRKWLLFAASLAAIPALGLLAQTTRIELVAVLVCVVWFTGGIMAAMIHTLIGLFSGREERGKVFGILGSANGLARSHQRVGRWPDC